MSEINPTTSSKDQQNIIVEGVCEASGEWQGTASDDGMICTPAAVLPQGDGTEYEENE